ncbi:MAG: bifunctional folylpolyglutamate synthase/dihydrofolate synthase [Alphaproteobacteria bacterium]
MGVLLSEARAKFASLNKDSINLGLDRMNMALERLGHPEKRLRGIVHISGTNGKGSTVAALETAGQMNGYRVQSFTSPFLWSFNENVRLNGIFASENECAKKFEQIWRECKDIEPTWFEADTLVAFLQFAEWNADITIIECGMGGISDATAAAPKPVAAILTNVGNDHAEFLGSNLDRVAVEKARISKGSPLYVPADFKFNVGCVRRVTTGPTHPSLALANAVMSKHFHASKHITRMPTILGRWQRDTTDPSVIYDVGHNAHAAEFLAEKLAKEKGPYRLCLGMLKRKSISAFMMPFQNLNIFVDPVDLGEQGHSTEYIARTARDLEFSLYDKQGIHTTLITGSHQTVALANHLRPAA